MRKHLTKISSIARVLNGGLCVLLPHYLLDADLFGNYAILLSTSLIFGYFLELGIGLASMTTQECRRSDQASLILLAFKRDTAIAVVTIATLFTTQTNFSIFAAASVTASLISWQGILRANNRPFEEFTTNTTILFGILAAAIFCSQDPELTAEELLVLFVALPRLLSLCICLPAIYRIIKFSLVNVETSNRVLSTVWRCSPFWAQSLFAAATSNFDTIIAASVYGPKLAGVLKVITTIINLGFSPFEILYHYLLNEKVNNRASNIAWTESTAFKFVYSLLLAATTYMLSSPQTGYIDLNNGSAILISLTVGSSVFFRSHSIQLATMLSISGRQSTRVKVLVFVTCAYWLFLWLTKFTSNENAVYLCIAASSVLQLAMYRRAIR